MAFDKPFSLITEAEIRKKYMYLSAADKTLFDEARHAPEHGPNCKCMTGTVGANSFGDPVKVYPIGSRFNHSCDPNVMMLMPLPGQGNHQTFRTLKALGPGEEMCFNYSQKLDFLSTSQREIELRDGIFHFTCLCSLCRKPRAQNLASDMRRVLLRHLHFWLRKKDVPEVTPCPVLLNSTPDPKLLKQGVYTLLYALLQEAEGIITGGDAYLAYAYTVLHVLNIAFHYRVADISPRVVRDMRMWMQKSEENVLLQFGDLGEGEDAFQGIRKAIHPTCVPDNGEMDWENISVVAMELAMSGMSLLSSAKP